MKQELIDILLKECTADDDVLSVMRKLPDEAFASVIEIEDHAEENGADWVTRQFQQLCRQYLSDDTELMRMIDEDEAFE